MARAFLNKVTITGADDSINPKHLLVISDEFPFVEWGILLSKNSWGKMKRFPCYSWMTQLYTYSERGELLNLSGHVCGTWMRQIMEGDWNGLNSHLPIAKHMFKRYQLNSHAEKVFVKDDFYDSLKTVSQQIIIQLDGVNNYVLDKAYEQGCNVCGLFDKSHGAGLLPQEWESFPYRTIGYAGGLSPANIKENLDRISNIVTPEQKVWVDVETNVRSNGDQQFDLKKVMSFLEKCLPYVQS